MDQRLSLITLGVDDVSRARAFYEALGWHLDGGVDDESDHVAFFQTPGCVIALWGRQQLAVKHGLSSSRQAISQHLDVLESAGLVRTRRQGRYKFHHLDTGPLETIVKRWRPDRRRSSR